MEKALCPFGASERPVFRENFGRKEHVVKPRNTNFSGESRADRIVRACNLERRQDGSRRLLRESVSLSTLKAKYNDFPSELKKQPASAAHVFSMSQMICDRLDQLIKEIKISGNRLRDELARLSSSCVPHEGPPRMPVPALESFSVSACCSPYRNHVRKRLASGAKSHQYIVKT